MSPSNPIPRRRSSTAFTRILLSLSCLLLALLACDEPWDTLEYIRTGRWPVTPTAIPLPGDEDSCWTEGDSWKYTGKFLPRPGNPWQDVTNTILLQFNTHCTDVYGYSDYIVQSSSYDRTEIGTNRISFKGTYNIETKEFKGTVYVNYDLVCQGSCEGYEAYIFDYPAVWNATLDYAGKTVSGWVDGFGDFLLDSKIELVEDEYLEVPGLEIWP